MHRLFRRRRGTFIALSLLVSALAVGCGGGGGAPRGDLSGSVTDVEGRAVAGATVRAGGSETVSLSNGTFTLTALKENYQRVVASADVVGRRWSGETWVDLVGDYQNRSVNVVISDERDHASIGGSVIDPNGFPLEGAKVFIGGPFGSTMAIADRNGNYVAERLTPGATYTVTASLAGYKNDTRTIHLDANEDAALSFALATGSNLGTLPGPTGVGSLAWTLSDTVSRAAAGPGKTRKPDIYDWLQASYRRRRGLSGKHTAKTIELKPGKAPGRVTPVGSVVEVDLFWDYESDPQLFGYAIKRALSASALPGSAAVAVLRDPLASWFFDVDFDLTPDTNYYYTVHRLDTITFPASGAIGSPSSVVSANPFTPIRAQSPTQGQSVTGTPVFRWSPVNGAAAYEVYVWDEFPTLMYDPKNPTEPLASQPIWPANPNQPGNALMNAPATSVTYQGPALQAGHTYYWLVVALDTTDPTTAATFSVTQIAKFVKR